MEFILNLKLLYCEIAVIFYIIQRNTAISSNHVIHPTLSYSVSHEAVIERKLIDEFMLSCSLLCSCSAQKHKLKVDCSNKQLLQIPPNIHVSTSELILFKNQLIDIHYNISLNKLETLNMSHNNIIQIDREWISTLKNLHHVDLSRNSLKSNAIERIFSGLPLVSLNLSNNRLKEITEFCFYNMDTLRILDISKNNIQRMNHNCFSELKSLEVLNLSFNMLTDLRHEWFNNLQNLKILHIRKNNLRCLSNVVFWSLHNLEYLDLSENSILPIGLLSFKGLLNLQLLNISNNNIDQMQEGIFRPLEKVKVIDLSNNPFQTIDKLFTFSKNVEFLYLRSLRYFKVLTSLSLKGLINLKTLDFSNSQLSAIDENVFFNTKTLRKLDISNSNLTYLTRGVFNGLTAVETIKLSGNPWKCNCYLYWLLTWLSENSNAHLLSPSETICNSPPHLKGHVLLDALDHSMACLNASIYQYTEKPKFRVGSTALLQCQAKGSPAPILTWITPQKLTFHWLGTQNNSEYASLFLLNHLSSQETQNNIIEDQQKEHFLLMDNGNLLIKNVERSDGGFYICIASNPLSNQSISIRLILDYGYFVRIKIVSILVGMATSFGFLLLTLISVLIKMILKQCGVKCPCRSGKSSPKTQQIRKILESMEHYKKQQLDRLRDNYNFQVQRIKDNCMQQMEKLRESYSSQSERLRDIRDYGTLQIDRIRENYYLQVQRVRDYSTNQIVRLRENYLFQRNRIRKFSTDHLYKLRKNYKLQQQHLNKILENLNIESCRNVCQRTDSIIFEPDISLENVFVPKICLGQSVTTKDNCDSMDNSSQISAYFTPDEAGSELSGHESDEQESAKNNLTTKTYLLNSDNCPETDQISKNKDSAESSMSNIHPDVVVLCDSRTVIYHANETIV